jgi:hypothetical protein
VVSSGINTTTRGVEEPQPQAATAEDEDVELGDGVRRVGLAHR